MREVREYTTDYNGVRIDVRIDGAQEYWGERARLTVHLPSGDTATVTAAGPEPMYGSGLRPAMVNWSALGSRNAEDALAYAFAVAAASELAGRLSGPVTKAELG